MSNHVKMFQPWKARKVERGESVTTIRPTPKRAIKPGDTLSLREWTAGARRKGSKQRIIGGGIVESVEHIYVGISFLAWGKNSPDWCGPVARELAIGDGFKNSAEMRDWFQATQGLPFWGVLIRWRLV